ncbi:MAG: NFACT family protein [archaeon]
MNSLEFFLASKWLAENLPGAKIDKGVSRISGSSFGIEFYSRKLGGKKLLALGKGLLGFLPAETEVPGSETWKFGRQFLSGLVVSSAGQVGFDRILRISFSNGTSLVAETFDGNLLLLGREGRIVFAREPREWRGRKIAVGEEYRPPKGPGKCPDELSESDLTGGPGDSAGRLLAVSFGFGPEISGRIIDISGADGIGSQEGRRKIISAIRELFSATPSEPAISLGELTSPESPKISEKQKKLERLEKSISTLEQEEASLRLSGEKILGNLREIDELISLARAGKRLSGIVKEFRRKEGRILVGPLE